MIFRSLCNSCFHVFEIFSEPEDAIFLKELVKDDMTCKCPRLCGGRINLMGSPTINALASDPRLKEPMHITAKELFRAVHGGGLPDEIPKSTDFVELLFKSSPVAEVRMQQLGARIYIHEIRFQDGKVLHLSSGLRGAEVLKITKGPTT